jgi:hypothetical protein
MKLTIDQAEAQKVLNYLAARPYAEVAQLVPILVGLQPVERPVQESDLDTSKTTEEIFDEE